MGTIHCFLKTSADDQTSRLEFDAWHKAHDTGFYLNVNASKCMLHRVSCSHLGRPADWTREEGDPTSTLKVCAGDEHSLDVWAHAVGRTIVRCSDCCY